MEHGHHTLGAERAQLVLELAGFVDRLVDERLDRGLAEGTRARRDRTTPMKP
jgi:hypothetical protein